MGKSIIIIIKKIIKKVIKTKQSTNIQTKTIKKITEKTNLPNLIWTITNIKALNKKITANKYQTMAMLIKIAMLNNNKNNGIIQTKVKTKRSSWHHTSNIKKTSPFNHKNNFKS